MWKIPIFPFTVYIAVGISFASLFKQQFSRTTRDNCLFCCRGNKTGTFPVMSNTIMNNDTTANEFDFVLFILTKTQPIDLRYLKQTGQA